MYLYWDPVKGADTYQFQLNTSKSFDNPMYDKNEINATRYNVISLDYDTKYFWRVRAEYENGVGEWSEIWHFTTLPDPNSVAEMPLVDGFAAETYPNPFPGVVHIDYRLAKSADVRIDIMDINGRRLTKLDAGHRPPGMHRLVWNAVNAPNGSYYIRFVVDGAAHIREVVLRK
jgi:hypothetical protein